MYHSKLPTLILHMWLISYQFFTRLHYCLVLLAPTLILAIDFVYPNPTIWCCLWLELKIVLLMFYFFFSKPNICHPFISNFVATCPSPSWSFLLPLLATPHWFSFNVYWRNPYMHLVDLFFLFINFAMRKWGDLQLGFWITMTICNSLQLDVFLWAWMLSNKLHGLQ